MYIPYDDFQECVCERERESSSHMITSWPILMQGMWDMLAQSFPVIFLYLFYREKHLEILRKEREVMFLSPFLSKDFRLDSL